MSEKRVGRSAHALWMAVLLVAAWCAVAAQTASAAGAQQAGSPNGPISKAPSLSEAAAAIVAVPAGPLPLLHRRRIGLALGGGGALALSEIGVLRWFEDNHIPVDALAGTSMGALVGSLYATGHTPQQMADLTTGQVFAAVFRLDQDFRQLNFRRREDARFLPGGFTLGLRHGVSFRNGVLLDYGLNQFLSAQFLPFGANYSFDDLPVPFRCVATDILVGREAVFNKGPLAEAVRASISIPGVFPPLSDGGHIYVDGALTENLPTDLVKNALHADVVLAVSLPLTPPDKGDTNSLLGVLGRSFSVAAWSNEVRSRALADVIIEPVAPPGVGSADYAASARLTEAGYAAAEQMRAKLTPYRLGDAAWETYMAERRARSTSPIGNIATIQITAPTPGASHGVGKAVASLAGKPLNPQQIDLAENEIRSDGRYDSNYFLSEPGEPLDMRVTGPASHGNADTHARELLHPQEKRGPGDDKTPEMFGNADALPASPASASAGAGGHTMGNMPVRNMLPVGKPDAGKDKPGQKNTYETVAPSSNVAMYSSSIVPPGYSPKPKDVQLNILVRDKAYGPPFLLIGPDVLAQSGGTARATVDAVVTEQDFGGYRSELRARLRFGFLTEMEPEYQRRLTGGGLFAAPRIYFLRSPEYIYAHQKRIAERQQLLAGGGFDMGYTVSHDTEVRVGWHEYTNRWHTTTGGDGLPDVNGHLQEVRALYRFNGQDRALIPQHGLRVEVGAGVQYGTTASQTAPKLTTVGAYFRDLGHGNTLSFSGEGGSFGHRTIADPFRFTLGGPLRLAASAYDEYRGTDFYLVRPAYFRRIASLPAPLGQSIYVVGTYEFGQVFAPSAATVTRQDFFFGLAAETPVGAITFGEAIGSDSHRKTVFTLGRFF